MTTTNLFFLIDYHNVHAVFARSHPVKSRRPRFAQDVVAWVVEKLCTALREWRRTVKPDLVNCELRFYSGWFRNDQDSEQAGMVRAALRAQPPVTAGRIRYRYTLATSLVDVPGEPIRYTLRPRPLPHLDCAVPFIGCVSPGTCGVAAAANCLNADRCTVGGCTMRPSNLLSNLEQKIVDSHIVCDIISLAEMSDVVLVSNDTDFVPPMLLVIILQLTPRTKWL